MRKCALLRWQDYCGDNNEVFDLNDKKALKAFINTLRKEDNLPTIEIITMTEKAWKKAERLGEKLS